VVAAWELAGTVAQDVELESATFDKDVGTADDWASPGTGVLDCVAAAGEETSRVVAAAEAESIDAPPVVTAAAGDCWP